MGNENEELLRHEKALNLINDEAKLNKYIEDYNLKKYPYFLTSSRQK